MGATPTPILRAFRAALVGAVLAGAACARPGSPAAPPAVATPVATPRPLRTCGGPAPAAGATTVREVDWCNRSYLDVGGELLAGGEHEEHVYACEDVPGHAGEHTTAWNRIVDVAYGDLDGDGAEDAAVLFDEDWIGCGDQGSTRITRIRVLAVRDGAVEQLGEVTLGRAFDARLAAVPALAIDGREVTRTYAWNDGGTCVDRWRLSDGHLGRAGPPCT